MRTVKLISKTKDYSAEFIWKRITAIEEYPKRVKFVKKILSHHIKKNGHYTDVTVILWKPITIYHTITEFKENEKMSCFAELPLGGVMWMHYVIKQKKSLVELYADITFDLGNPIYNKIVGYILEKRLAHMFMHVFPEMPDKKVLKSS